MINEDIPGVEVTVLVNHTDAKEYDAPDAGDEDEARPTRTKYIECIDNAFFKVQLKVTHEYDWHVSPHDLELGVYVDGKYISGRLVKRHEILSSKVEGIHQQMSNNAGWKLHKLQFAPIKTVDDAKKERVEQDMKAAKLLGVIEVRVQRGTMYGSVRSGGRKLDQDSRFELAEKSLKGKAVSHGTTLRHSQPASAPNFTHFENFVDDDGPIAKFVFLYRSRESLKREMIIPRTPTPPPPAFATLTDDDLRRLARERFEQLQQDVKKEDGRSIKREIGQVCDLTGDDNVSKKRKGKMTRLDSGRRVEVIDLSDDDDDD